MSERAYSLELKEEISAKKASELSRTGVLSNAKNFRCGDFDCAIDLTCTNWNKSGKKYYFTPSFKDELHIVGCTQISVREEREQTKREAHGAKETIKKNGVIKMTKSNNQARTNIGVKNVPITLSSANSSSALKGSTRTKEEYRHMYSIASFIDLFSDNDVDNNAQFVSIDGKELSLNTLFISTTSKSFTWGVNRIFYGEALLKTSSSAKGMLEIEFCNSTFPKVYSNIPELSKRTVTSNILDFLDKNIYATVYVRGKLLNGGKKLESFNDKVYKDLLFR